MGLDMQLRYATPMVLALLASTCLALPSLAQDTTPTDWSGFYAGVYGGYGIDKLPGTSSSSQVPFVQGENNEPLFATVEETFDGVDSFLGGIRGGWNYQHGGFVMGVESALTFGSFTRTSTANIYFNYEEDPPSSVEQSFASVFETNAIATFEGRLGVAVDNWLLYGKGGVAVAYGATDASGLFTLVDGDEPENNLELPASASTAGLLFGASIGVGAEVLVTDSISVGAEYNYLSLPAQELTLLTGGISGQADASQGPIGIHTLKAGINYHF
ncbi:MAG: porin family protein [Hyphomicrobiales bacterium]|nr:MAG: porin family protein [Hyphomicrobiales bacterium]